MRWILCLVALVCINAARAQETWTADNGNGTYSNPLFYDEFADPDLIRVGSDFYLTGSSMHMMPGIPVLHSRDLVNWDFVSYALDKLDLGPEYRLENGKDVYGQGIWAPSCRYHEGTFYIFANVNHQTTQMFRATSPQGPWTRTPMKRSFHDLSVLFDDDGKTWVVWGYGDLHIAQLDTDLLDVVPGTERILIPKEAGMGEGSHFYKIHGKYFILSAWYLGVMRLVAARADRLTGPWEVNRDISVGEQFGQVLGWRLDSFRPPLTTRPPYKILAPDPSAVGRMAIHQGGIVETPTGEWWGISMGEENAIGRVVSLSPVTWQDGWPYFGLPHNLGRTPRMWIKPHTGTSEKPHAPYVRSDDFSETKLQPIWQWNHVPVDGKWSLTERPGYLRLHALSATGIWDARDTLTQRAIGPRSIPTAVLETAGMKPGDRAGLALLIQPDASIGVERTADATVLIQHDGQTMRDERVAVTAGRLWLRVDCYYLTQLARFQYSTDGDRFHSIGEPFRMVGIGVTFQGVRYSLFDYHVAGGEPGYADFDSFHVEEPAPRGLTHPIPYNQTVTLSTEGGSLHCKVMDRGHGRVALPSLAGDFQWIETFAGNITLLSLETNRYLRYDTATSQFVADSSGPEPDGPPGVQFHLSQN